MINNITGTIITLNNEHLIEDCITSLKKITASIIVNTGVVDVIGATTLTPASLIDLMNNVPPITNVVVVAATIRANIFKSVI